MHMIILLYHNNSFCETYKTLIIKGFLIKTIRIKKPCRKKTGHHIRCPAVFRFYECLSLFLLGCLSLFLQK